MGVRADFYHTIIKVSKFFYQSTFIKVSYHYFMGDLFHIGVWIGNFSLILLVIAYFYLFKNTFCVISSLNNKIADIPYCELS